MPVLAGLGAKELARLALVSKAVYAFAHDHELWKPLVLGKLKGGFVFQGCGWKDTYAVAEGSKVLHKPLKLRGMFSDRLFRPWHCAAMAVPPAWTSTDNIPREAGLTLEEFHRKYERPNRPVIITDRVRDWPAFSKWSRDWLIKEHGEAHFAVGPVRMKMSDYYKYHDGVKGLEERPLYLFDKHFARNCPSLADDYAVPEYFQEDLFSVLQQDRPEFRWLIIGPEGSGSSFHIDPNSTSAWNAVITGSKLWLLFPPERVPPGVHPSASGGEVTTPVSIKEWFFNFYDKIEEQEYKPGSEPLQGVCRAGEVLFVPNGWWHLVLNLEDSIAITQNYVSRANLINVLSFLKHKKDQISGCHGRRKDRLYERFLDAVTKECPDLNKESIEEQVSYSFRSLYTLLTTVRAAVVGTVSIVTYLYS